MKLSYTKLNERLIRFKMAQEPTFKNVYKVDLTKEFLDDINNRINNKYIPDHVVIIITGSTGTFKTSIAIEIARLFDNNFKHEQIAFTNQELLDVVKDSKPQQFFIRDEQVRDFGVGSSRVAAEVATIAETLRARQNSFLFLSPSPIYYPAHYTLETFKGNYDFENNIGLLAMKDINSNEYIGRIAINVNFNNDVWLDYKKRKDIFIEKVVRSEFEGFDIEKASNEILDNGVIQECRNSKEMFLVVRKKYPHLTKNEQELIVANIRRILR